MDDYSAPSIVNPKRLIEMEKVYNAVQKVFDKSDARISYELHEPYNSVGSIGVNGKSIQTVDTAELAAIMDAASNVEVFPRNDGDVCVEFTFRGLTIPLDMEGEE